MKRAVVVLLLLIANVLFGESTKTTPDNGPGELLQEGGTASNAAAADSLVLIERKGSSGGMPTEEAKARKPAHERANEVDTKLKELTQKDRFSGAALIAKDGKPVWQEAL